jgi:hypothetical protein
MSFKAITNTNGGIGEQELTDFPVALFGSENQMMNALRPVIN